MTYEEFLEQNPHLDTNVEIGDYVLATKFNDGEIGDHYCVGYLSGMLPRISRDRYDVVDSYGNLFRGNGFRCCIKISESQGKWFVDKMNKDVGSLSGQSIWYHYNELIKENL